MDSFTVAVIFKLIAFETVIESTTVGADSFLPDMKRKGRLAHI